MIYVLFDVTKNKEISQHHSMEEAIIAKHEFHSQQTETEQSSTAWKIKDEATGEVRNLTMEEYKKIMKVEYGDS